MYDPSIWDAEMTKGRQQYIAYVLGAIRKPIHMAELARMVDRISREENAIPNAEHGFHNTRYRRTLTRDIDAMNRDRDIRFIIVSDANGVQCGNKAEAQAMIDRLRRKALKTLKKASILADKAGLDCQLTITGDEIRTFKGA